MAILIDLSHVVISTYFASVGSHGNKEVEVQPFRNMLLNTLNRFSEKFVGYGDVILAADSDTYWRKSVFKHYKAQRAVDRKKSDIDWPSIYEAIDVVTDEIENNFPYNLIRVSGAEADDVIGVLAKYIKPSCIISGDKDFLQLQKHNGIVQYDHIKDRMLVEDDPKQFLHDHIISGDRGDGIPNVRTRDDIFVTEGRQDVMTQKRRAELSDVGNSPNDKYHSNWLRNKQLIDLDCIPNDIAVAILKKYSEGPKVKDRSRIMQYLIDHKLADLLDKVNNF